MWHEYSQTLLFETSRVGYHLWKRGHGNIYAIVWPVRLEDIVEVQGFKRYWDPGAEDEGASIY